MTKDPMTVRSRKVKPGLYEVEGVMFYAKNMSEAVRKWSRFSCERKVKFRKLDGGNIYLSEGYYVSEEDFSRRNATLIFEGMTKIARPIPKKKEDAC